MNLKGIFNTYYEKWTVYLLVEEGKELLGLYAGELKGKGTNADFQMTGHSENINHTSKCFTDVKGLAVISSGNKKYATFWKDTTATIESFQEYQEEKAHKPSNVINFFADRRNQEEQLEAMSMEEKEEPSLVKQEAQRKQLVVEPKVEKGASFLPVEEKPYKKDWEKENPEANPETKPEPESEPMEEPESNLSENWNRLVSEYKNISPFPERDIQCIRIELKDLRILPKQQWILSSNSFVLHGFYNYQYLILGKVKDRFIIGVPGIFCNKEKLVAGLFGFNDFKPAQVSEYKTGRFGYWYKYITD
ncbi:DUF6128 domain-containing protein [Konateibacter massiliensis]|uniref:DUF6128 domain-containing protein n=1 Tax=Konateibacter massiliensis TaxID=2002841 RepID=UPI00117A5BB3|nr:DUF6128 domain-containing protein [Konateibacter massiliensis]